SEFMTVQIETGTYQDFSRSVNAGAPRVPINGTIEVSHRCPLNCSHCYNNLPMADADARHREMTTEEHHRLVDELAEAGCLLLLERNLPLKLKTVGVTINKHEVPAMRQMAADFGVDFMFDSMMNPRIDCSASPLAVRLAPHEVVELDLQDPRRVAEWRRLAINHAPPPASERVLEMYDCGGGLNSFAIDPYGDL